MTSELATELCVLLGLRKVTDEMKTHKNPELRASSVVKASNKPAAAKVTPKATTTAAVKKPPVCELQGKKWVVVSSHAQCIYQWRSLSFYNVYIYIYDPSVSPSLPGISRWQP